MPLGTGEPSSLGSPGANYTLNGKHAQSWETVKSFNVDLNLGTLALLEGEVVDFERTRGNEEVKEKTKIDLNNNCRNTILGGLHGPYNPSRSVKVLVNGMGTRILKVDFYK
ncbi:hypothetical protein KY285_023556 [Solanum tuberosum]|nr:hypothetical protein KY289_025732 [Solanum tuberosum]KAH0675755.1 hypothetical protein KY285_023556 [Solanum tuberosum]